MIRLLGLHKSFPRQTDEQSSGHSLSVSDFEIQAGERVALVGASGSGKTTLLNLMSGLILPDQGSVEVDGVDITQLKESARDRFRARTIGYLFQTSHLLPGFSALENVELGASFAGRAVDRDRAKSLLDAVGLGHRHHHQPQQLSVGQQSRVALARALVNRPKVVLADEPTGALDPESGKAALKLLLDTAGEENITVICATHDAGVASVLDRTVRVEELQ
ncbi:MAG: ABC transporter ATP-binding protein [Planctomycetota bacterium]|nr:MAG: ABC transporter ATP-binding protein [Planctomycetota bacterium]